MEQQQTEKTKKSAKPIIIILVAVIIVLAAVLILWMNGVIGGKAAFVVDDKAGAISDMAPEDIAAKLQKDVDESEFSFRINSAPEFENGTAEGNLMIENPTYNTFLMKVEIKLDATGDTVYTTDILNPGTSIALDVLDKELKAGEYPATAGIYAYDPTTEELVGQTAAGIVITVNS
ncbi:MAG: hypothetical protein RR632_04035 [Christensenella sp.]